MQQHNTEGERKWTFISWQTSAGRQVTDASGLVDF
jgi:hypothetical protein